jgi:hypothetical protein
MSIINNNYGRCAASVANKRMAESRVGINMVESRVEYSNPESLDHTTPP